ncbi:unnamed protein product [Brachionus calyciflorus]|uniref:CxC5 like cysteine cluster associated with KDZ domain-containing protein n=1 Tax=Brachionus calyciflorus TaxID=104777 RepID=A0A814P4H2_9BILA|nr:unnamed protein product [Brachionus calyciflorus]
MYFALEFEIQYDSGIIKDYFSEKYQKNIDPNSLECLMSKFCFLMGTNIVAFKNLKNDLKIILRKKTESVYPDILVCKFCESKLISYDSSILYTYSLNKSGNVRFIRKSCTKCQAFYEIDRYGIGAKTYFYEFSSTKYFKLSNQTVFHLDILIDISHHIARNNMTFEGYSEVYNHKNGETSRTLNRKRLSEIWFSYQLRKYQNIFDENLKCFDSKNTEFFLEGCLSKIHKSLFDDWIIIHEKQCRDEVCKSTVILDGNLKCNRLRCIVDYDSSDENSFGCPETPKIGSYYCEKHIISNMINNDFLPPDDFVMIHSHQKNKKGEIIFHVKFNSAPKNRFIEKSIVEKWTAEYDAYIKNYNKTKTEKLSCILNKDLFFNKKHTAGITLGATGCGFILNFKEMIRSESLKFVSKFLIETSNLSEKNQFKFCIYDNSCHLSEYCQSKIENGETEYSIFKETYFVIDNFHIKNHCRSKCTEKHSAKNFEELKSINTQICEELFSRISKSKHNTKHMGKNHFIFYYLVLFDSMNKLKYNAFLKN